MYFSSYGPDRATDLDEEPTLHDPVVVTESELGAWTEVRPQTRIHESEVGDYTYLMERVQLDYTTLGKFGSVASAARLGPTNHPIDRPTAHHCTYRASKYDFGEDDESIFEWRGDQPVTVGNDVWIGHGATVLPGVSVGNGAVVGAGAIVTSDVDPYTVVAGVPAEQIGRRFPESVATRIEATAWWDWDHETIGARLDALRDPELFLQEYAPEEPQSPAAE